MGHWNVGRYALTSHAAAAVLVGCGAAQPPIQTPSAALQSHAIATRAERVAPPSYLYVADPRLHAIVAFDSDGNMVAEKIFKALAPVDVVTDSRGHVYTAVYTNSGFSSILELTHTLDREIARYHPPGFTSTMAVDASDNLYVNSAVAGGFDQNIVQYPYGSTRAGHTYSIVVKGLATSLMAGISARKNVLYAMTIFGYTFHMPPLTSRCLLSGSYGCDSEGKGSPHYATCGYTTTANRQQVYGVNVEARNKIEYDTIGGSFRKRRHDIDFPPGYWFGNINCNFHGYRDKVWAGVQSSSGPAEVLEVDVDQGKIVKTIGAGILEAPQAAYYGNGFTP
jgi:hypothetical protein